MNPPTVEERLARLEVVAGIVNGNGSPGAAPRVVPRLAIEVCQLGKRTCNIPADSQLAHQLLRELSGAVYRLHGPEPDDPDETPHILTLAR